MTSPDAGHTMETLDSRGAPLPYRRYGDGPGLVIVHGMMQTGSDQSDLARRLAADHAVYLYDRAGFASRRSQPFADGLSGEAADLVRLLEATGAKRVMGVSVGGLVCRQAMTEGAGIDTAIIFEPPLPVAGSLSLEWIPTLKAQLAHNDRIGAMVSAMVGAQMGPPFLAKLPIWLLRLMTRLSVAFGGEKGAAPFVDLAPTLAHDADLVIEATTASAHEPCNITSLLLGTTGSPEYFRKALTHLEAQLPNARRITIEGKDHQVTCNADRGGDPACIADIVARYLSDSASKSGDDGERRRRSRPTANF